MVPVCLSWSREVVMMVCDEERLWWVDLSTVRCRLKQPAHAPSAFPH